MGGVHNHAALRPRECGRPDSSLRPSIEALTTAIFAAFVVGKPAGIVLLSFLAVTARVANASERIIVGDLLAAGSLLTGIGFTMALFIAELAFEPALMGSVKLGVMGASVVSAAAGFSALKWMTRGNDCTAKIQT